MIIKQEIQELISIGRTEQALELLEKLTNDAVLLKSRFNGAKKQYGMGLIDFSEWTRIQAQINYAALEMMNASKTVVVNHVSQVIININMAPDVFKKTIDELDFEELYPKVMEAFKHEPKLLEKVYDLLSPIDRALKTSQPLQVGQVASVKAQLVEELKTFQQTKAMEKKKQQTGDLSAIIHSVPDEVTENDILSIYEKMELFLVSNPEFKGIEEMRQRRKTLLTGENEEVLRRSGRLQPFLNEERAWLVSLINKIIQRLEQ